jgi:hypothetical protein
VVAFVFFATIAVRAGAADGFRYERNIQVGTQFLKPSLLLPGQPRMQGAGYDGQFYFAIAQDPLLRNPDTAASLDGSFRYRRILYPLVVWTLSTGRPALVPAVLIWFNVAAATVLVALCAWAARRAGRTPWSVLVIALFPGVWIPVLLDLTEPLHLALLAAGILAASAGLLLLSTLAKEPAAVVLLTVGARAFLARDWARAARFAAAGATFGAWTLFVQWFAAGARQSAAFSPHFLDPPGAPFLVLADQAVHEPLKAFLAAPVVLFCVISLVRLLRVRDAAALGAGAYSVLVLASGRDIWIDFTGYYRIMAAALVLVYLSWITAGDPLARYSLVVGGALWALITAFVLLAR